MRTTNGLLFLGIWEYLYNEKLNSLEFDGFKNESGTNTFVMTPKNGLNQQMQLGLFQNKAGITVELIDNNN